jgi:hypothetical protein
MTALLKRGGWELSTIICGKNERELKGVAMCTS